MSGEGPVLERLTARLAECPPELYAARRGGVGAEGVGPTNPEAIASDLVRELSGAPITTPIDLDAGAIGARHESHRRRFVAIAAWLLHDAWFRERGPTLAEPVAELLRSGFGDLARLVAAERFVVDPDRREELVRTSLKALGVRPEGETEAQAADRLAALDTLARADLIREAKRARERARRVREELARKAAEEAAAKVTRE